MINRHRALSVTGVVAALLIVSAFPVQRASAQSGARPSKPPALLAGKFRITINGFHVTGATRDHILDIDGVGDEVYVSANVIVVDSSQGLATPLANIDSRVYGETRRDLVTRKLVWPSRVQAGSGVQRGGLGGGLRSGDQFPREEPGKRASQPTSEYLPLEVWCGTLTQGQNAVVMIPSIWEYDGETSTFGEWVQWGNEVATSLTKDKGFLALAGPKVGAFTLGAQLALGAAVSLAETGLVGGEQDRPIGVLRSKTKPKTFEFTPPHKFVLNYQSADYSTRENAAGSVGGMAPGIYQLQYRDDPFYQGRYTLYVQIERIDGGQCIHAYVPPPKK